MKLVRTLSSLFYYLTRILALFYFALISYALVALALNELGVFNKLASVDLQLFTVFYPGTSKALLLGEYTSRYIITNFGIMGLYGLFFWLLGDVFTAYRQDKLFTVSAVKQLTRFYSFNLLAPLAVVLLMAVFAVSEPNVPIIAALHIVIGIFGYFMATIFKQGLSLQDQSDFTI